MYGGGGGFEYGGGGDGGFMYGGMNPMGDGFDGMQGGGFMEGVSGALGEKSADKKSREKAVLAVTIKQLIDAPADGDGIRVDGTEVSMVRLLGLVEHVEDHSTNKLYRIRDGTGVYDCKMWIEKDPSSHLAESEIRPNTFVRVVGQIKEFAGTRHILLYNITPVVDWNELTHHMLEVILTHCQATKGPIPGSESAGARFTSRTAPGTPSYNMGMGMVGMGFGQSAATSSRSDADGNLSQQILTVIKEIGTSEMGTTERDVLVTLQRKGIQAAELQVRRVIADLQDNGLLYGTIDEQHFKATED